MKHLTVDARAASDAVTARDHSLAVKKLLLRVGDHEGDGSASGCKVAQVASRLCMCEVILSVRARLDNEDLEGRVCIGESTSNKAACSSS